MFRTASIESVALALATSAALAAQSSTGTRADSAPVGRFVNVERNVKLEVLDWGGTGRPMVLLTGLGNTAHVFDDLAHDLRANYHVYGITRRGFGRSSVPDVGYSADRLGDDVLAVVDSLHLVKPVLVGHSIAGEELSSVGSRHGDRVSALIYLDAASGYAFYDTTAEDFGVDLAELQRKLAMLRSAPSRRLIDELLGSVLPAFERDLRELRELRDLNPGGSPPPGPPAGPDYLDRSTFEAFRAWQQRTFGFAPPVVELRERFEVLADGSVGRAIQRPEDSRWVSETIIEGEQKYLSVSAPVLAIFAQPPVRGTFASPAAKAVAIASDSTYRAKQANVVRRAAPMARVVDVPGALHYVFLTNEADVVREINAFVKSLPPRR
jgi:pimeloyl-ACP methyl ester carboxylesterase